MKLFFAICATSIFFSCNQKISSTELTTKFYRQEASLNIFIDSIKNNRVLDSVLQKNFNGNVNYFKEANPKIFKLAYSLGISEVSAHKKCKNCDYWYYIQTNWGDKYPIYLIYDYADYRYNQEIIIDSSENVKGFYKKDDNNNETWGLGNKWKMFRLVKENQMKQ
jgi:hypothetical protein